METRVLESNDSLSGCYRGGKQNLVDNFDGDQAKLYGRNLAYRPIGRKREIEVSSFSDAQQSVRSDPSFQMQTSVAAHLKSFWKWVYQKYSSSTARNEGEWFCSYLHEAFV